MEIKEGDIFHWSYPEGGGELEYWATSQICVAANGVLRDTYWTECCEGRWWTFADAKLRLVLKYIANFADLERKPESSAIYYDDSDIVNLNHRNSSTGNFYIRKGAKRSKQKMLAYLHGRIEKFRGAILSAERRIQLSEEQIKQIERGDNLDGVWI